MSVVEELKKEKNEELTLIRNEATKLRESINDLDEMLEYLNDRRWEKLQKYINAAAEKTHQVWEVAQDPYDAREARGAWKAYKDMLLTKTAIAEQRKLEIKNLRDKENHIAEQEEAYDE